MRTSSSPSPCSPERAWRVPPGPCRRGGGVTSVSLGIPSVKQPPPVLAPRRKTRKVKLGDIHVGGDAPITVQSMTTTPTHDINATLQQIAELTAAGCDIVRVACPRQEDA